jgi:chromosome segregation ATPase
MDKDEYIWKQRNEILHKKVNRQMEEIKDLNKKSETIFDLARKFPNKTYSELEKYRDADRHEEAAQIPLTESQKYQAELEPLTESQKELVNTVEKAIEEDKIKKGVCVTGALRKDRLQDELDRVKKENNDLFLRIAELTEVEESHRKANGKIQERLSEVEEDNKKLSKQVEDRIGRMRKSGM